MEKPFRVKLPIQSRVALLLTGLSLSLALAGCGADEVKPPTVTPIERQQIYSTPVKTATLALIEPPATVAANNQPTQGNTSRTTIANPAMATPLVESGGLVTPGSNVTVLANAQIGYLQGGNLWIADEKGGNRKQLTQSGGITVDQVIWSPSRDKVIIFDKREGITLFDLTGKRTSLFRPDPTIQNLNSAAWSPDGRYLGFDMISFSRESGQSGNFSLATDGDIFLVDTQPDFNSSTGLQQERPILPQRIASGFNFAWSPDGQQIAYATRAHRLGVIENSPPAAVANSTAKQTGTPGVSTTPQTVKPTPTPNSYGLDKPTHNTSPTGPGAAGTITPNPYYNPARANVPYDNNLAVFAVASRRETVLAQSIAMPPYPSPDGNAYPTENFAIQYLSWSPDGKQIAFGDRVSYVATINLTGGGARMLYGQPRAFSLNRLYWVPGSNNSLMVFWNSFPGDERTVLGVLTAPGVISSAVSDKISCPAISPVSGLLAYFNGEDTQIIQPSGSTYGVIKGGGCAAWSPDGNTLATPLRGNDGTVVIFSPQGQLVRQLLGTRAVDQVFWFKPGQ